MEKVIILMSTYNGEKYLEEQINSILNQKNIEFELLVRDDGSTDETISILEEYKEKNLLNYYIGDNLKPAHSFMDLLYKAPKADYYAFADQDDFWKEEKMIRAIEKIKYNKNKPSIYFSNVEVVDEHLNHLSINKKKPKINLATSFSLCPAIGCTMVINDQMRQKIICKNIKYLNIGMHDSWIYRVGNAISAKIVYDSNSYIKYRQHENNVVGMHHNQSILKHIKEIFRKRKKIASYIAENILNLYLDEISNDNKIILNKLIKLIKPNNFFNRLNVLFDKKFYTNRIKVNAVFFYNVLKGNF